MNQILNFDVAVANGFPALIGVVSPPKPERAEVLFIRIAAAPIDGKCDVIGIDNFSSRKAVSFIECLIVRAATRFFWVLT